MLVPSHAALLEVWERARGQSAAKRAMALLAAAHPEATRDELAALALGERDARLLELRLNLFGARLNSVSECPRCRAQLEFAFDVQRLIGEHSPVTRRLTLKVGQMDLQLRPIDSNDLLAAAGTADSAEARKLLCERCVVEARRAGSLVPAGELPDEVVREIDAALATADPNAELLIELRCDSCAHCWSALLDVASFLWKEVDHLARSLLREVHTLAWAYGWREADILAMSAVRRRFYVEAVS
jgi:hypothetical protein